VGENRDYLFMVMLLVLFTGCFAVSTKPAQPTLGTHVRAFALVHVGLHQRSHIEGQRCWRVAVDQHLAIGVRWVKHDKPRHVAARCHGHTA